LLDSLLQEMLRSRLLNPDQHHAVFIFRAMATKLKDYVSHYDILEVTPECTKTEIRESWLRLSMLYHPDLNKEDDEATKKFMEIKESYKILINDQKRNAYNDKIGFYHADPPPNFQKEWTFQGEKELHGARAYHVLWSEEAVRKLMCSDRLRELNWNKQPPAERYRILEEEQKKQNKFRAELSESGTLSLKVGSDRYFLIFIVVVVLIIIVNMYDRQEKKENMMKLLWNTNDYITEAGGVVSRTSLVDSGAEYRSSIFEDPARPNNYWVTPGQIEGLSVPDNSANAPNPSPLDTNIFDAKK